MTGSSIISRSGSSTKCWHLQSRFVESPPEGSVLAPRVFKQVRCQVLRGWASALPCQAARRLSTANRFRFCPLDLTLFCSWLASVAVGHEEQPALQHHGDLPARGPWEACGACKHLAFSWLEMARCCHDSLCNPLSWLGR